MTYNLEIKGLIKDNIDEFNDVITNIIFRLININDLNINVVYDGNVRLDLNNLNEQTFIALNQLNNTILLEWLETTLKADDRYWLHINEAIENQYRMKVNTTPSGTTIAPL
jgi:hypothetical protein